MSKFCQYCGTKLEDADTFCPECGKKQNILEANPAPKPPPRPVPPSNQPPHPQYQPHTAPQPGVPNGGYPRANSYQAPPNPGYARPAPPPVTPYPAGSKAPQPDDKSKLYVIIGILVALLIGGGLYMTFGGSSKQTPLPSQTAKTETAKPNNGAASKPAASSSQQSSPDVKTYTAKLQAFETRLGGFADRINSGKEDAAALKAVGNVLKDDIVAEQNNLRKLPSTADNQELSLLLKIQWKRADCMVRGLAGVAGAYAEGGGYYDEFQAKFNRFRQSHGV